MGGETATDKNDSRKMETRLSDGSDIQGEWRCDRYAKPGIALHAAFHRTLGRGLAGQHGRVGCVISVLLCSIAMVHGTGAVAGHRLPGCVMVLTERRNGPQRNPEQGHNYRDGNPTPHFGVWTIRL